MGTDTYGLLLECREKPIWDSAYKEGELKTRIFNP